MDRERYTVLVSTTANWSKAQHHGFWDAWWALSQSGRLTLLAQVIDYDGTLRRVYASPPSLIVESPGEARQQAVVFGRTPDSGPWAGWLGFALHSDAHPAPPGFVCSMKDGLVGSLSRKRIEPDVTSSGTIFLRSVYRDRDWIDHDHVRR